MECLRLRLKANPEPIEGTSIFKVARLLSEMEKVAMTASPCSLLPCSSLCDIVSLVLAQVAIAHNLTRIVYAVLEYKMKYQTSSAQRYNQAYH
jgi:hypothetical protein